MTTLPSSRITCAWVLCSAALVAQDSRPNAAPTPAERVLARVHVKTTSPLCFASPKSPAYVDVLVEGDVVQVGPPVGEYRALTLPLGPTGYVSKKYSSTPVDGVVKTIGGDVAFRYRVPKSVEAPVHQLPKDAELHVLGEEGDWWIVRSPNSPAYLSEKALTILPGEPAAAEAALRATQTRRRDEWTAAAAAFAKAQADAKVAEERRTNLDALQRRVGEEMRKANENQDYAPLQKELETLKGSLPQDSNEFARALILEKEIARQIALLDLVKLKNEAPVKITPSDDIRHDVPDALGTRATAVGWLRARKGNPAFEIEKGGIVLYLVGCASGRYDLSVFEGSEIAVIGNVDRPMRDSVRVLDAQRIEVIAPKRR